MITIIKRSVFLSLFSLLLTSLLIIIVALVLNERFIDSVTLGWICFLFIPNLLALPMACVSLLLGLIPPREDERHRERFLKLFISLLLVPAGGFLILSLLAHVLESYPVLIICGTFLGMSILIAVCFSLAKMIAPKLASQKGTLRWSLVMLLFLILIILPIMGSWLSNRPISSDNKSHTLVFGVDAADWSIIDRMTTKGDLPTFQKLCEEGTRFDLVPIEPLMSPMLWTTIASGVGAEKHSIIGPNSYWAFSSDVKAPRLWDMVEQNNGTVGLLGWPITWPPRPLKGFIIPSAFDRGPETYPKELQFIRDLALREKAKWKRDFGNYMIYGVRSIQYGIKLSTFGEILKLVSSKSDSRRKAALFRFLQLRMHGDLFLELWARYQPTFAAFYNNIIDMCGHYFWKYYDLKNNAELTQEEVMKYGDFIPEAYRRIDIILGKILRFAPNDLNVVIVSDHSMRAENMGSDALRFIHTEKFIKILNLEDTLFASNMLGSLYLRPKSDLEGFPDNVRLLIDNIKVEETGESIFILNIDQWGSLIIKVRPVSKIEGMHLLLPNGNRILANEIIDESETEISGTHNQSAILLLKGPSIRKGMHAGQASILDVAPTTLYMMGCPIGENMDGRLLREAFLDGYLRRNQARYLEYKLALQSYKRSTTIDDSKIKEILKSLGYIR